MSWSLMGVLRVKGIKEIKLVVKIFEQYGLMKRLIVLFKVALTHNVFITWFCLLIPAIWTSP